MKSIWILLLTNCIVQGSIRNECPAQEDVPKCTCRHSTSGLTVVCGNFETNAEFENHLKNLQEYSFKKLEINNYNASTIPTTLWKGQKIQELSLENVEVNDASFRKGQLHFQGLEHSLETLDIKKSFKNGYRPLLNLKLDHLENLKYIIMEHNDIPEVGNDWFASGPKELSVLIFEKNGIEELGDKAFSSLRNLKLLAVAGNHLHTITREMLPEAENQLTTLDLAYNKIRTLPKDIFFGMPSLSEVNLEFNLIHMIQKDTWGSVSSQLNSLMMEGNVLQCDNNMQWICDTKLKLTRGKCSSPIEKKGMSIKQFCKV